jgi:mannose-6-phosphate isomerase-like protein (cupin superfamily)
MHHYAGPIEQETLDNEDFRRVLFTGKNAQLVLMCLQAGEEIGVEVHEENDQFFRIEQGTALFTISGEEHRVEDGSAVIVPAGAKHNVQNVSDGPLKLYTIYSPPHHPDGTVHETKADADAAEAAEHE